MKLNLGCGNKKYPGTVGVDISNRYSPDIVHDLNVFPYPFESGAVELCI